MNKSQLVTICSRSWSLMALRLLADGTASRVSPLAAAAGCGRTSMSASVVHLGELGLVERNPGYGHPLRPEFRLTRSGKALAAWAADLYGIAETDQDRLLIRSKWSLPLISCLPDETRYSELRRQLHPVSDRALSQCLGHLSDGQWVHRSVSVNTSPPAVSYRAIHNGIALHQHLQHLPPLTASG